MRKKTLRIVAIVTCFAIISLSVPSVANAKDDAGKFSFRVFIMKHLKYFSPFLSLLGVDTDEAPAPSKNEVNKMDSNTDLSPKVKKITGTVSSMKDPDDD
jgi:hypothetical protein